MERMRRAERRPPRRGVWRPPLLALLLSAGLTGPASAAPDARGNAYAFAVLTSVFDTAADEAPAQRLLDAISRDRSVSFIVYDGNLKGTREACRDALYEQRLALFNTSRLPLVFIPGQADWATCGASATGGYDPVERLDFLRQDLFSDPASFGQTPLALTRESEVPRFRPYRENVRWVQGDTVYVGLNAPAPNNRYLIAGGRNGEFEDRVIANGFWIDHAAEYARRRDARALVIFIEGDPQFERSERADRFAWLRFNRPRNRDGFRELKRALVKAAATFRGPVLVVHANGEPLADGFRIDRPLRDDKGDLVANLTRIAVGSRQRGTQWLRIGVNPARQPMFSVGVRSVPKSLPQPPALPVTPRDETPLPSMPEIPALPDLPEPGSASEAPPPAHAHPDDHAPEPQPGASAAGSMQGVP
jgi:hypothetical protein